MMIQHEQIAVEEQGVRRRCGGIRGGGWEGAWPRGLVYRKLLYEEVSQPATSGAMSYRDRWGERQHSCRQLLPVAAHWTKRTTRHPSSFSSNTMFTDHVKPINLKLCWHRVGVCRGRSSMLNYMQVQLLLRGLWNWTTDFKNISFCTFSHKCVIFIRNVIQ